MVLLVDPNTIREGPCCPVRFDARFEPKEFRLPTEANGDSVSEGLACPNCDSDSDAFGCPNALVTAPVPVEFEEVPNGETDDCCCAKGFDAMALNGDAVDV